MNTFWSCKVLFKFIFQVLLNGVCLIGALSKGSGSSSRRRVFYLWKQWDLFISFVVVFILLGLVSLSMSMTQFLAQLLPLPRLIWWDWSSLPLLCFSNRFDSPAQPIYTTSAPSRLSLFIIRCICLWSGFTSLYIRRDSTYFTISMIFPSNGQH